MLRNHVSRYPSLLPLSLRSLLLENGGISPREESIRNLVAVRGERAVVVAIEYLKSIFAGDRHTRFELLRTLTCSRDLWCSEISGPIVPAREGSKIGESSPCDSASLAIVRAYQIRSDEEEIACLAGVSVDRQPVLF